MIEGKIFFREKRVWITVVLLTSLIFLNCESLTFKQGKILYEVNCANCHGLKGEGLGALIPPLAQSDYLVIHYADLACLVGRGVSGEVIVNGEKYGTNAMPPNERLTDFEIANIFNYVNDSWGNNKKFIPLDDVREQLKKCE